MIKTYQCVVCKNTKEYDKSSPYYYRVPQGWFVHLVEGKPNFHDQEYVYTCNNKKCYQAYCNSRMSVSELDWSTRDKRQKQVASEYEVSNKTEFDLFTTERETRHVRRNKKTK